MATGHGDDPQRVAVGAFLLVREVHPRGRVDQDVDGMSSGIAAPRSASPFMIRRPSSPWRYSIVKKKTPPCSPMSWTWAMFGVIENRRQPRFLQEHPDQLVVRGELRKDALEHHVLFEALDAGRERQVDLRHAAECDPVDHPVFSELRARPDQLGCSSAHDSPQGPQSTGKPLGLNKFLARRTRSGRLSHFPPAMALPFGGNAAGRAYIRAAPTLAQPSPLLSG